MKLAVADMTDAKLLIRNVLQLRKDVLIWSYRSNVLAVVYTDIGTVLLIHVVPCIQVIELRAEGVKVSGYSLLNGATGDGRSLVRSE